MPGKKTKRKYVEDEASAEDMKDVDDSQENADSPKVKKQHKISEAEVIDAATKAGMSKGLATRTLIINTDAFQKLKNKWTPYENIFEQHYIQAFKDRVKASAREVAQIGIDKAQKLLNEDAMDMDVSVGAATSTAEIDQYLQMRELAVETVEELKSANELKVKKNQELRQQYLQAMSVGASRYVTGQEKTILQDNAPLFKVIAQETDARFAKQCHEEYTNKITALVKEKEEKLKIALLNHAKILSMQFFCNGSVFDEKHCQEASEKFQPFSSLYKQEARKVYAECSDIVDAAKNLAIKNVINGSAPLSKTDVAFSSAVKLSHDFGDYCYQEYQKTTSVCVKVINELKDEITRLADILDDFPDANHSVFNQVRNYPQDFITHCMAYCKKVFEARHIELLNAAEAQGKKASLVIATINLRQTVKQFIPRSNELMHLGKVIKLKYIIRAYENSREHHVAIYENIGKSVIERTKTLACHHELVPDEKHDIFRPLVELNNREFSQSCIEMAREKFSKHRDYLLIAVKKVAIEQCEKVKRSGKVMSFSALLPLKVGQDIVTEQKLVDIYLLHSESILADYNQKFIMSGEVAKIDAAVSAGFNAGVENALQSIFAEKIVDRNELQVEANKFGRFADDYIVSHRLCVIKFKRNKILLNAILNEVKQQALNGVDAYEMSAEITVQLQTMDVRFATRFKGIVQVLYRNLKEYHARIEAAVIAYAKDHDEQPTMLDPIFADLCPFFEKHNAMDFLAYSISKSQKLFAQQKDKYADEAQKMGEANGIETAKQELYPEDLKSFTSASAQSITAPMLVAKYNQSSQAAFKLRRQILQRVIINAKQHAITIGDFRALDFVDICHECPDFIDFCRRRYDEIFQQCRNIIISARALAIKSDAFDEKNPLAIEANKLGTDFFAACKVEHHRCHHFFHTQLMSHANILEGCDDKIAQDVMKIEAGKIGGNEFATLCEQEWVKRVNPAGFFARSNFTKPSDITLLSDSIEPNVSPMEKHWIL